jgi:iron complex outermembrane receptor protein
MRPNKLKTIRFIALFVTILLLIGVLMPSQVIAVAALDGGEWGDERTESDTVVVTGTGLARRLLDAPVSVTVVEADVLQHARQHLQLDEALTRVPGVVFNNRYNFAQNLRIAVRGFGARSPFGVRGLQLLVDGFPETLPDGQAQLDMIDLLSAQRIEVLRGVSSALYGNAAGGVIAVDTVDGRGPDQLSATVVAGSYGFRRAAATVGGERGAWHGHASVWQMDYDGYRQQSATRKRLANVHAGWQFDDDRQMTLVATALDQPFGQDPGALTRAQVEADRRQASAQAVSLDSGQSVEQTRVGLRWADRASLPGQLRVQVFAAERDFQQQLPSSFFPSLIEFDRSHRGWQVHYDDALNGGQWRWLVGVESAHQRDQRRRFRVNPQAQPVAQTQDELQAARAEAMLAQVDSDWGWLGVRHDRTQLRIVDRFTAGQGSGQRRFDETSVIAGVRFAPTAETQWHVSGGTAFETPTFTEIKDAAGGVGFSRDLDPQYARNLELGWRLEQSDRSLAVTAFDVRTRDEIVVIRSLDGLDEFTNAGITRRRGLEVAAQWQFAAGWTWASAWTLADYTFVRFVEGDQRFDGLRMPGLPRHQWFNELRWHNEHGLKLALDGLLTGAVFADNANQDRVASAMVFNLRGAKHWCQQARCMEVFAAVNNLTDRDTFANVRINVANRAYFEPAPDRNLFMGLRWQH